MAKQYSPEWLRKIAKTLSYEDSVKLSDVLCAQPTFQLEAVEGSNLLLVDEAYLVVCMGEASPYMQGDPVRMHRIC